MAQHPSTAFDNSSTSSSWQEAGNWNEGLLAGDTDDVVFYAPNAVHLDTVLGIDETIKSLTFNGPNASSISGNTLTLRPDTSGGTALTVNGGGNTINSAVALGNHQTWSIAGQGLTVGGVVSGTFSLIKTGSGTLTLNGNNTFSEALTVREGTLNITTINNANSTGTLGNSAASVTLGGSNGKTGTLAYTGSTATSNKTFTMGTGGTGVFRIDNPTTVLTLSGAIGGSGGLTKTGEGTLELTGANTFTGATTVAGGTLSLVYSSASDGKLNNDQELVLSGARLVLSGAGHTEMVKSTSLKAGASTIERRTGLSILQMNGINRDAGATLNLGAASIATTDLANTNGIIGGWATVSGLHWATTSSAPVDNSPVIASSLYAPVVGGSIKNNTLNANVTLAGSIGLSDALTIVNSLRNGVAKESGDVTISSANTLRVSSGGVLLPAGGSSLIISTGGLTASSTNRELTFHNYSMSKAITVNAPVINGFDYPVALTKAGPGTLALTAANPYTGATTINEGSLLVNGSLAGTATTINSGGVLGGTGTLAGPVNTKSGGAISPGATASTPAKLTVGNLTLDTGSVYQVGISDASSTPGVGWDLLASTGLTHGDFTVKLTSYSGIGGGAGTPVDLPIGNDVSEWLIASTTAGAFDRSRIALDTSGFQQAGYTFTLFTSEDTRALYVGYTYSAVPEASTILLGAVGLAPVFLQRRGKRVTG